MDIAVFKPLVGAMALSYLAFLGPSTLVMAAMPSAGSKPNSVPALIGHVVPLGLAVLLMVFASFWFFYAVLRLILVVPSSLIERKGARATFARSWGLMKGNMMKAFWLGATVFSPFLIFGAVAGVRVAHAVSRHTSHPMPPLVHPIIMSVIGVLIAPLIVLVAVLLYCDVRLRQEGFKIESLAEALDRGEVV